MRTELFLAAGAPSVGGPASSQMRASDGVSWLTVRPWVGHVASLSLSFPVYKTGVSVPTSKVVPGQG